MTQHIEITHVRGDQRRTKVFRFTGMPPTQRPLLRNVINRFPDDWDIADGDEIHFKKVEVT